MSEAGRDDVWTDLEQLLREGKLGIDSSEDPCPDAGTTVEAAGEEDRNAPSDGDPSGLPFEDLLTELLGSWDDDRAGRIEGDRANGTEEPQVSLPDLMARLMEGAETSDSETVQSLEALQQRLSQEPAASVDSLTLEAAPPIETEPAAADPLPEEILAELAEPVLDEAPVASVDSLWLEAARPAETEPAEAAPQSAIRFGDLPAPGLRSGLLEALLSGFDEPESVLSASPAETHAVSAAGEASGWADDLLAALVQADEASHQTEIADESDGDPTPAPGSWETLALLPAPAPPNLVEPSAAETILFEPPLPPDSVLDWPVVEQGEGIGGQLPESDHAEEVESGSENEADDSLRRLVGLMLAEIAASASPSEQTPSAETSTERTTERFLSFSLAGEVYAVDLAGILETDRLPRITRVPGLPAWAIGVSNLRGTILPVVDLRRLLNLEESENPSEGRILVARPVAGDPLAALVVDRLEGVALLAPGELHPAPQWLDSKILPYLEGIGSFKGRLVNVLDLGRLFSATGVNGEEPARTSEAA